VAQAIHALIKANDALTMKYLGLRSTRHEDAAVLFGDLIKQNKVDPKLADLRRLLTRAVAEKSNYDYKGTEVSKATASGWLRDVERFLETVPRHPKKGITPVAFLVQPVALWQSRLNVTGRLREPGMRPAGLCPLQGSVPLGTSYQHDEQRRYL